ncbi:hypothetical protein [Paenibacillus ginsengihumi]|uniref:hypothetical protein n=1 Tax=Paenibacillus ginsengihumi TaxID=431596 RepID=UPI0012EB8240|nr:hypothetical protein [Paenibacillus ginsengihumi]
MLKIRRQITGKFSKDQPMLYFIQQKRGNNPHPPFIVVESATFWAIFFDLKPIARKLLYKIQHSPTSCVKDKENVVFFAGFAASCVRVCPGRGSANASKQSYFAFWATGGSAF